MIKIATVGIDLAKHVFMRAWYRRTRQGGAKAHDQPGQGHGIMAGIGPCLVGVEACSGAHHWARELGRLGHAAKIMAPRFVAPYRKSGKNDGDDAEAIANSAACCLIRLEATAGSTRPPTDVGRDLGSNPRNRPRMCLGRTLRLLPLRY